MAVELGTDGYKSGEWFCVDFQDTGAQSSPTWWSRLFGDRTTFKMSRVALQHLETVRSELRPDLLYGFYGADGNLKELEFEALR